MNHIEAMKQALEALRDYRRSDDDRVSVAMGILQEALAEQPAQQQEPVAYDKTEINCFAQDLYDQKMREGKHGHYESMFHVIHQCIKKVSPQQSKPWVKLTDEDIWEVYKQTDSMQYMAFSREIEAKLRKKNGGAA